MAARVLFKHSQNQPEEKELPASRALSRGLTSDRSSAITWNRERVLLYGGKAANLEGERRRVNSTASEIDGKRLEAKERNE